MSGDAARGPGAEWWGVDDALRGFAEYLTEVKGSSAGTADVYARHVRAFLSAVGGPADAGGLRGLSAVRVRRYVTDLGGRYSASSLKLAATSIRSFLRFAWLSGWTDSDLRGAVGPVVSHRSGRLPRALPDEALRRLLAGPDRRTGIGVRDYALLLLLARLGLRAGEAAALRLDDIDWAAATIAVSGKGGARRTLPIPVDVGRALVAHLRQRPAAAASREVFLQAAAPWGPMTSSAVTRVVSRNAVRAGLGTVRAHRLRHSAARAVLAAGGTLAEVGELLGHRAGHVTVLYASFDEASLRELARPWPAEAADA